MLVKHVEMAAWCHLLLVGGSANLVVAYAHAAPPVAATVRQDARLVGP